jgi:hypothetical protein
MKLCQIIRGSGVDAAGVADPGSVTVATFYCRKKYVRLLDYQDVFNRNKVQAVYQVLG